MHSLDIPILPHISCSMVSGLAEGALVRPHRIITSDETSWWRSIGHGWVVNVEEEDT